MEELLQAQLNAQRAGEPYAVVTIAEASGSVPRTSGKDARVFADGRIRSEPSAADLPSGRAKAGCAGRSWTQDKTRFLHYDFPYPGRRVVRGTAQHSH